MGRRDSSLPRTSSIASSPLRGLYEAILVFLQFAEIPLRASPISLERRASEDAVSSSDDRTYDLNFHRCPLVHRQVVSLPLFGRMVLGRHPSSCASIPNSDTLQMRYGTLNYLVANIEILFAGEPKKVSVEHH